MANIKNPLTIVKQEGGGSWDIFIVSLSGTLSRATINSNISLNVPNCTSITGLFGSAAGSQATFTNENPIVEIKNSDKLTSMTQAFRYAGGDTWGSATITGTMTIKLTGDLSKVTGYASAFQRSRVGVIDADIDFSSITSAGGIDNMFNVTSLLTSVRFVPNTLGVSLNFGVGNNINNASLVSLANCLKNNVTATLTLPTSIETRVESIMGTVTTVEGVNTFIADASGTVTLSDFITTIKGWSLSYS